MLGFWSADKIISIMLIVTVSATHYWLCSSQPITIQRAVIYTYCPPSLPGKCIQRHTITGTVGTRAYGLTSQLVGRNL